MIEVKLTPREVLIAGLAGSMNQTAAIHREARHNFGPYRWDVACEGAAAELAFAKYAGLYPSGLGKPYGEDDDVSGIEVRHGEEHRHRFHIYPDNADDKVYVWVTGRAPTFSIRGAIEGHEAKQVGAWYEAGQFSKSNGTGRFPEKAAWFVENTALHPVGDLVVMREVLR